VRETQRKTLGGTPSTGQGGASLEKNGPEGGKLKAQEERVGGGGKTPGENGKGEVSCGGGGGRGAASNG